jgi:2-methylcitrate dehydratase PrpD
LPAKSRSTLVSVTAAEELAAWAHQLVPDDAELALAERALRDTVAVAAAAVERGTTDYGSALGRAGAWAVAAHVLDFDDLHMASTAHVSAVIVPATIAAGGGAAAYLAGAGVMARLGSMLGWAHYTPGWHATCTAGAPAAAVAASVSMGLDEEATAHALVLALPAAGGVQQAFGTDAKSLQVGMAVDAGVRAAQLAALGARGDLRALGQWLDLVGAESAFPDSGGPAVPGGLAIKLFPCCYAMQRPIHAVAAAAADVDASAVASVVIRTPAATVLPLIHHRPRTGLEAKFSLEYAAAVALLDGFPTLGSFTDTMVTRPAAQALMEAVTVELVDGGDGLLAGTCDVTLLLRDGQARMASLELPPGAPGRPATDADLIRKLAGCGLSEAVGGIEWSTAGAVLSRGARPMSHPDSRGFSS